MARNRRAKVLLILSGIVGFLFLLLLAWNDDLQSDASGISGNIAGSKRAGAFIRQYHPSVQYLDFGGRRKIRIKEIWLEHDWTVGSWLHPSEIGGAYPSLYVSVPNADSDSLLEFCEHVGRGAALMTSDGHSFSWRSNWETLAFFASVSPSFGIVDTLFLIARNDTLRDDRIPDKWPHPVILQTIIIRADSAGIRPGAETKPEEAR